MGFGSANCPVPAMDFFESLRTAIECPDAPAKSSLLLELAANLDRNTVDFDHAAPVFKFQEPSYATICGIVHGSKVPRRRNLDTVEGRIIFLHAIAHIEYSAIDLALDSAYRFRNLPPQYYEDFLTVALDEARHFGMLDSLLAKLGSHYGSQPVHTGIFDAMFRSNHSLRVRMAATHRHLEANGLDAHPDLSRKFAGYSDEIAMEIREVLQVIYQDEISHVRAGDFWYRYSCGAEGVPATTFPRDVADAIPGARFGAKTYNVDARLAAGFTLPDIELMKAGETLSR